MTVRDGSLVRARSGHALAAPDRGLAVNQAALQTMSRRPNPCEPAGSRCTVADMSISSGWREQYDRMHCSYRQLVDKEGY